MTLADLFKELHDTAKERIKNPIIGAFICSFFVYNWRPIFILLFSEMSIEERIESVSSKWGIIVPLIIAIGYTLLIPMIMIVMDYALMPMKRKRISNIYENKGFTTEKKILIAAQEFRLKNAESGNKSLEEMEAKLKEINQSHEQIRASDRLSIDNLTFSLEESNKLVTNLQNQVANYSKEIKNYSNLNLNVSLEEYLRDGTLINVTAAGILRETHLGSSGLVMNGSEERKKFLIEQGIAFNRGTETLLNKKGIELWELVNEGTLT